MRRSDREVTDPKQIRDIIDHCTCCRLGFCRCLGFRCRLGFCRCLRFRCRLGFCCRLRFRCCLRLCCKTDLTVCSQQKRCDQ